MNTYAARSAITIQPVSRRSTTPQDLRLLHLRTLRPSCSREHLALPSSLQSSTPSGITITLPTDLGIAGAIPSRHIRFYQAGANPQNS